MFDCFDQYNDHSASIGEGEFWAEGKILFSQDYISVNLFRHVFKDAAAPKPKVSCDNQCLLQTVISGHFHLSLCPLC